MKDNNSKLRGCASVVMYLLGGIAIVGGLLCLPFGIVLIVIGIIWIVGVYQADKKEKQQLQQKAIEEAEKQHEREVAEANTNEALCEKTLAVIENNQNVETLNEEYQSLSPLQRECTLNRAFENIVQKGLEDGVITDEEENGITTFSQHFGISEEYFADKDWYQQYQKLLVIKDLLNGIIPQRQSINTNGIFLNLSKDEQLIWRFDDVGFFEQETKKHYEGGHSAASIRIAKGVYYKIGAVKGTPVITSEMRQKATGTLFVATKHLYFYSALKTFKIPFVKVVAFTPYVDGLGVQKDAASAKTQAFQNLDGWFAFNIVSNLTNL